MGAKVIKYEEKRWSRILFFLLGRAKGFSATSQRVGSATGLVRYDGRKRLVGAKKEKRDLNRGEEKHQLM